jgi:Cyanobacterial TRADD-N associated 2-Transmembrane domain
VRDSVREAEIRASERVGRTDYERTIDEARVDAAALTEIRRREYAACFRQKNLISYVSLATGTVFAGVFLDGAYLAIAGNLQTGIFTSLASTVPGLLSGLSFWQLRGAEKRAKEVLDRLSEEVANIKSVDRLVRLAREAPSREIEDHLHMIAGLHCAFPDAPLPDVAALLPQSPQMPQLGGKRKLASSQKASTKVFLGTNVTPKAPAGNAPGIVKPASTTKLEDG